MNKSCIDHIRWKVKFAFAKFETKMINLITHFLNYTRKILSGWWLNKIRVGAILGGHNKENNISAVSL